MKVNSPLLTEPKQQRSIDKLNAIEAAVHRIVLAGRVHAMTTNSIAEEANVDIKMLYRFFVSKEAIALYVLQRTAPLIKLDAEMLGAHDVSKFVEVKGKVWWSSKKSRDRMIVIAALHWYSNATYEYIDLYRDEAHKTLVKSFKKQGARGTEKQWRDTLTSLGYIQTGVLNEISRTRSRKKIAELTQSYEKVSYRLMSEFF